MLPILRFSREFGLDFCGFAIFLKTFGLLVFGLVSIKICLFFGLAFLQISVWWVAFFFKYYGTFAA